MEWMDTGFLGAEDNEELSVKFFLYCSEMIWAMDMGWDEP